MTNEQASRILELHDRAVKAAIRWWGATPGTQTRTRREEALDNAERRFAEAVKALSK